MEKEDMQELLKAELSGKNAAIHAYDKMVWTVRTGFLTLSFAGWGLLIKAAVETNRSLEDIEPYIFMLSATTIVIAISGFLIDRNYARRKFRVITAVNELTTLWLTTSPGQVAEEDRSKFIRLFQISGDAANKSYRSPAFSLEMFVSRVIYLFPSVMVAILVIILMFS